MALIKCPECGAEISDKCEKCIQCGYPLKKNNLNSGFNRKKIIVVIVCVVIVALIVGCCVFFSVQINNHRNDMITQELAEEITENATEKSIEKITENQTQEPTKKETMELFNLVGMNKDEAIEYLKDINLNYEIEEICSNNDNCYNIVLLQSPSDNEEIDKDDTVKLGIGVNRQPIIINNVKMKLNSVGGLDVELEISNHTDKSIKYVTLYTETYNSVGDPSPCNITGDNRKKLRLTGELVSGETTSASWDAIIYNSTTETFYIRDAEIDYMDGSKDLMYLGQYFYTGNPTLPSIDMDLNITLD